MTSKRALKRREEALAGKHGELLRLTAEGIDELRRKVAFISELENASEGPVRIRLPVAYVIATGHDDE